MAEIPLMPVGGALPTEIRKPRAINLPESVQAPLPGPSPIQPMPSSSIETTSSVLGEGIARVAFAAAGIGMKIKDYRDKIQTMNQQTDAITGVNMKFDMAYEKLKLETAGNPEEFAPRFFEAGNVFIEEESAKISNPLVRAGFVQDSSIRHRKMTTDADSHATREILAKGVADRNEMKMIGKKNIIDGKEDPRVVNAQLAKNEEYLGPAMGPVWKQDEKEERIKDIKESMMIGSISDDPFNALKYADEGVFEDAKKWGEISFTKEDSHKFKMEAERAARHAGQEMISRFQQAKQGSIESIIDNGTESVAIVETIPIVRRIEPSMARAYDMEREAAVKAHEVTTQMKIMPSQGGVKKLIENIQGASKGEVPVPGSERYKYQKDLKEFIDKKSGELIGKYQDEDKRADFWDDVAKATISTPSGKAIFNGTSDQYDALPIGDKVRIRESVQASMGVNPESMTFLSGGDIATIRSVVDSTKKPSEKMAYLTDYADNIGMQRFQQEIHRMRKGEISTLDLMLFNYVDANDDDRVRAMAALDLVQTAGPGVHTDKEKSEVEKAVLNQYRSTYGRTDSGQNGQVQETLIPVINAVALTMYGTGKGQTKSAPEAAKKAYETVVGRFSHSVRIGPGDVVAAVPKEIVIYKPPAMKAGDAKGIDRASLQRVPLTESDYKTAWRGVVMSKMLEKSGVRPDLSVPGLRYPPGADVYKSYLEDVVARGNLANLTERVGNYSPGQALVVMDHLGNPVIGKDGQVIVPFDARFMALVEIGKGIQKPHADMTEEERAIHARDEQAREESLMRLE